MSHKQWQTMLISCVIALFMLFGAWRLGQWLTLQKPLEQILQTTSSYIDVVNIDVQPQEISLKLDVINPEEFITQFPDIRQQIADLAGKRDLQIEVKDHPTPKLKEAWEMSRFGLMEAIDQHRFSMIPKTVSDVTGKVDGKSVIRIDNDFVYIAMIDNDKYVIRLIPIHEQKEVKLNV